MTDPSLRVATVLALCVVSAVIANSQSRPRARDLGIAIGVFEPGPLDAITDVQGVRVGHTTIVQGDVVRTGVTAVLPHGGNLYQDKVPGAIFVANGFGKLAGSTQVEEFGTIEAPVLLTNTNSVAIANEAGIVYTHAQPGNEDVRTVNVVVGETNDGRLSDIKGLHVTRDHVLSAIRDAREGPVEEGAVGAGTGTVAFGWKGGIGTASRVLPAAQGRYTVGVLVQSNFGGVLMINGAPVGKALGRYLYAPASNVPADLAALGDGSCMIVVATDAPLVARDLQRLAARAAFALARTGSSYTNGSGDYAIAFSTAAEVRYRAGQTQPRSQTVLPLDSLSPLFQAALESTEEAVYNSMLRAHTVRGIGGNTIEAIPIDRVIEILKRHQVTSR